MNSENNNQPKSISEDRSNINCTINLNSEAITKLIGAENLFQFEVVSTTVKKLKSDYDGLNICHKRVLLQLKYLTSKIKRERIQLKTFEETIIHLNQQSDILLKENQFLRNLLRDQNTPESVSS